jgi:hypothetical protein
MILQKMIDYALKRQKLPDGLKNALKIDFTNFEKIG